MVVATFHNTYLGYTETFIYEQLRRLRLEAHAVALAAQNLERFPFPRLHLRGDARLLGRIPRALERPLAPWILAALLRARARLLHAHFGTSGASALPYARALRLPLVVSYYGFDLAFLEEPEKHPAYRPYFERAKELFRRAALHLALSEEMRQRLVALGAPPERVRVHPNGVDLSRFHPGEAGGPRPAGELRVLLCGREVEKKGFAFGLRALARAAAEEPGIRAEFIGAGGPLRAGLEALAGELGLGPRLRFLPDREDIPAAMRRADLLLAPSLTARDGDREGLPTVLVEAAASGLPAVASRHAGIPEIVREGETGLLCEERDEEGLAAALVALARAPERRLRMGEAARRLVEQRFDIDLLTRRLEGYYLALAG